MNPPSTLLLTIAVIITMPRVAAAAAQLEVCVRQDSATDHDDFDAAFEKGPVVLPAGVIFDWAGHTFGGAADSLDGKHMKPGLAAGWSGVSKEEADRRGQLMVEDNRNKRLTTGLVTLATVKLIKAKPCGLVAVAAVRFPTWGWAVSPVFGDPGIYYQTYGIIHSGRLNTDWTKEPGSLGYAAGVGALNGVLRGTTDRVIDVAE